MGKSLDRAMIPVLCFLASTFPVLSQPTHSSDGQPLFGIMDVAEFGPFDIPAELPRRPNNWRKFNLKYYEYQTYYVHQQDNFYKVYPIFRIGVRQKYSKSGKGFAVPIIMRIDSRRIKPKQWGTNDIGLMRSRRITLGNDYPVSGRVHAKRNRSSIVKMAKEVLEKTVCSGGTVTEDHSDGSFATSYNGKTRNYQGIKISAGWLIKYRCSRWRAR
ncbi:hypothetical protein SAMN04487859_10520 [Roseovarius lutimaris]|uniref:Uncharacterized protein n=1 Tax=Roseovarius lutimaris TaxID=1005928 RepID=A0A1I5A302_9RHOB|nr:hypothetical protein [Roseovarius lutimaris]SFN56881.1 hypothetical protein SAMN04487859_10520 [Roseovarius lutimaris]